MAKMTDAKESGPYSQLEDKIDATILDARRLFISDAIDAEMAQAVIRKLWYLELKDPGKPILIVINSPGGSVDAGFAIWDQVKIISSPVATLITGLAASMGSVLALCAAPERRYATAQARIMIHQPRLSGVIQGQATDLEIQAKEMIKTRKILVDIYVEATGKTAADIEESIDRDTWMTAAEAKEFGLLSKVVSSYKEIEAFS
jgi:ATP-dependent Clp protease protease subunit